LWFPSVPTDKYQDGTLDFVITASLHILSSIFKRSTFYSTL
jgi:hypothetical protein